jgi:hypothetical protein
VCIKRNEPEGRDGSHRTTSSSARCYVKLIEDLRLVRTDRLVIKQFTFEHVSDRDVKEIVNIFEFSGR